MERGKDVMLKIDDIREKAVEVCRRGRTAVENTFVRRQSILGGGVLVKDCARSIEDAFLKNGYSVQCFEIVDEKEHGVLVQIGRKSGGWRRHTAIIAGGLDLAVCAKLMDNGLSAEIEIGGGRWIDKMFSGVVTWSLFAPLLAIPAIGVFRQRQLIGKVEAEILAWYANNRNRLGAIDV